MTRPRPELNHALIQHLAADVHALRAAVLAIASQTNPDALLAHYDAAGQALLNQKLHEPSPDEYQDLIAEAIQRLRRMLELAAAPPPTG